MSYSNEDLERVYCACRAIFSGTDAQLRKKKKVREVLIKNRGSLTLLFASFGEEKTILMSQFLLENRAFESDLRAKVLFPSLFESTPQRDAEREASEADAVRSVANALNEMSQSEGDDDDEIESLPKAIARGAYLGEGASSILKDFLAAAHPVKDSLSSVHAVSLPQESADVGDVDSGSTLIHPPPYPGVPSLYPSYIPYNTQHTILTTTQRILEECCFDFANKWIPHVLQDRGWDCASAVELTKWTNVFKRVGPKLPANATTPAGTSIKEVLVRTHQLRHTAVHRLPTTARGVSQHLRAALKVAKCLQDVSRAAQLEELMSEIDEKIKAMELTKNVLENRTLTNLDDIRRQREALDRQEEEVIDSMVREDRDHKALVGRLLETAVNDIFERKLARGQIWEEDEDDVADIYYETSEENVNGLDGTFDISDGIESAREDVLDTNGLLDVD
ncbi:hypothetical protein CORC01_07180 [Colletotrichum orchidophilum]|uniref:Ubiquinol-cytochrome-c reductase cytochrome c1 n=1 Tax=Colletotrichum orchidophilum TaxID=1209926 RepID=A0A1G4B8G7_9PEZI|nr:uncharacterized protein CORC01_07180 [Colletotrichum orchidophilum]OHE97565.1 hypothetical protein CORC01_07180 [Colletotrichum orchidophilum]